MSKPGKTSKFLRRTVFIVGCLLTFFVLVPREQVSNDHTYSAEGYTEAISSYIAPILIYNPNPDPTRGELVVSLPEAARKDPQIQAFLDNSYLRKDLSANDPRIWDIQNGDVKGVDPNAHNISLPLHPPKFWKGNIRTKSKTKRKWVVAVEGPRNRSTLHISQISRPFGASNVASYALGTSRSASLKGERIDVVKSGNVAARLFLIGDVPVVRTGDDENFEIYLDSQGINSGKAGYFLMPAGVALSVVQNSRQLARFVSLGVLGLTNNLSTYGALTGRARVSDTEKVAKIIEQDMGILVGQAYDTLGDSSRDLAIETMDIDTSIDPDLHSLVQEKLRKVVSDINRKLQDKDVVRRGWPASITVMNALNGEILAVASMPEEAASSSVGSRLAEQNHNFINYSVGSVSKPILAAPIIDTRPSLIDYFVNIKSSYEQYIGCSEMSTPVKDHISGAVGLKLGMSKSSNIYFANLMMMGLSDPNVPLDVNSENWSCRKNENEIRTPKIAKKYMVKDIRPAYVHELDPAKTLAQGILWDGELRNLFDVRYEALDRVGLDPYYEKRVWAGAFEHIADIWGDDAPYSIDATALFSREASKYAFRRLSPEVVNIGLNSMNAGGIRSDYVSLVLGGGRSRWNNVKVAEIFSRLVTGTKVAARLTPIEDDAPRPESMLGPSCQKARLKYTAEQPDGKLCPEVRSALLRGLAETAVSGTGWRLSQLPWGKRSSAGSSAFVIGDRQIVLYAKTGTPQIPTQEFSRLNGIFRLLGEERVLHYNLRSGYLDIAIGGQKFTPTENIACKSLEALLGDPNSREFANITNYGITPQLVAEKICQINSGDLQHRRNKIVADQTGKVLGLPASVDNHRLGKAFAVVAAAYEFNDKLMDSDCPRLTNCVWDKPPVAAYAVVVNFQARAKNESVFNSQHVLIAKEILEYLKPYLKGDIRG